VSVTFAGTQFANPVADAYGRFQVTIAPPRRYAGTYQVTGFNNVCAPSASCPRTASANFVAVPQSSFNNPCGAVGSTVSITITGTNFPPKSFGYIVYDPDGPDQQAASRIPTNTGTFSWTFSVVVPNRSITLSVYDVDGNVAPNLTWRPVACPPGPTTTTTAPIGSTTTTSPDVTVPDDTTTTTRPGIPLITTTTSTLPPTVDVPPPTAGATLTLNPRLGPPGFVTGVVGTGFPPGAVQLDWSGGVGRTMAIAGPDGTFSTRVLILPRDRLGPRALVATGQGGVTAYDGFLVVPSSVQPSSGREVAQITRIRRFTQR
jgi:hypothetical protein